MSALCYFILAVSAYLGGHEPLIVGTCYLALSLLVLRAHQRA